MNKGQFTIVALVAVVIAVVAWSALSPVLYSIIEASITEDTGEFDAAIMRLIPAIITLCLVMTAIYYVSPNQPR